MPKLIKTEDSSYNRILKWVQDPENCKLSAKDKEIYDRLDFADTQLRRKPRKKEAANMIIAKYGVTKMTAYNYLWLAQKLFGSIHPINKDWWRNWLVEDILLLIESCKSSGDLKVWATAHANLVKALGLDQKEELPVDPDVLSQHNFYTVININNKMIKVDMDDLVKIPVSNRRRIIEALSKPITETEATEIMNS